jgi:hypothetical protein
MNKMGDAKNASMYPDARSWWDSGDLTEDMKTLLLDVYEWDQDEESLDQTIEYIWSCEASE